MEYLGDGSGSSEPAEEGVRDQGDALQAFLMGDLEEGRILVGDGQKLTPQVVDLFVKVDIRLRVSVILITENHADLRVSLLILPRFGMPNHPYPSVIYLK
jgi:hypothetical protein